jgi:predicted RNA-binding protein with PUA-like domain
MAYWLFKEEPTHFSYAELEAAGETIWDGVKNALAKKYLLQVREGDEILFYHTGTEKAVVGVMKALSDAQCDENSEVTVRVAPARRLPKAVTLAEIKADPALADWELTRLPRLSIMPVSAAQWRQVMKKSRLDASAMNRTRRQRRKDSP